MRRWILLLGILVCCSIEWAPGIAQDGTRAVGMETITTASSGPYRVAILIGNQHYARAPLVRPHEDVNRLASALTQTGFQAVRVYKDVQTSEAFERVANEVRVLLEGHPGAVVFFYYSGHAMQLGGSNYLIPTKAKLFHTKSQAQAGTFRFRSFVDVFTEQGAQLQLYVLDACRSNPFADAIPASFKEGVSQGLGDEAMPTFPLEAVNKSVARGWKIFGRVQPGQTAPDDGRLADLLSDWIRQPGAELAGMMKSIGPSLRTDSTTPWEEGYVEGDFYFVPPSPVPSGPGPLSGMPAARAEPAQYVPQGQIASDWQRTSQVLGNGGAAFPPPKMKSETDSVTTGPAKLMSPPSDGLFEQLGGRWIPIPAGDFERGSRDGEANELPVSRVEMGAFLLSEKEITIAQYRACVDAGVCTPPAGSGVQPCNWGESRRDNFPVDCVEWSQASTFARWIGARLPTETEWEYAAKSRTRLLYPGTNDANQLCHYGNIGDMKLSEWFASFNPPVRCNDGFIATAPVGSYLPNAFGLFDMLGNVEEWVADCYEPTYVGAPADGRAREACAGQLRVLRGGGWHGLSLSEYRASARKASVGEGVTLAGFRVARDGGGVFSIR